MKFGVKTYFDAEFTDYFKDKADFLEVMAIPGKDYSFLDDYPLPIVVHAMHNVFGVNFVDEALVEKNREAVDFAIEVADRCGAEKIIVHPGRLDEDSCSVEQAVDFLEGLDDRIIIENLTVGNGGVVSSKPEEMRRFIEKTGRKICFDVNHAIAAAEHYGEDSFEYVKEFLEMGPVHYHLGGQVLGAVKDGHLSFEDSDIPVEKILGILPEDAWVTLETTTDIEAVEKDLGFVRGVVNDIGD